MAIERVFRIVVSGTIGGTVTMNNALHIATDTAGIGPGLSAADVAVNVGDYWFTGGGSSPARFWKRNVGASVAFNSVTVTECYPGNTDVGIVGLGGATGEDGSVPGGVSGVTLWPNLPAPCAGIVTWKTARAGRSGRGRTYFAGLVYGNSMTTAECVAPGSYARGKLDAIASMLFPLRANAGFGSAMPFPGGFYLVVVSRKLAGPAPYNLAGVLPVIGYSIPNYWATMGSRRGGHGV